MSRDITLTDPPFTAANPEDTDYESATFTRGHLTATEDRTRNLKDYASTFILSNILLQSNQWNGGPWEKLEEELKSYAVILNQDIYNVAGGYDTKLRSNEVASDEEKR